MDDSGKSKIRKQLRGSRYAYAMLSIFVIIGVGSLIYAPIKFVKTFQFIRNSVETTGTVVHFHESRDSKSTTYAPEVTFTGPDGTWVRFRSQIGRGSPAYTIGELVPVRYNPQDPSQAEINEGQTLWMPIIILFSLGIAFTALGGGFMAVIYCGARNAQQKGSALEQGFSEWQAEPSWQTGTIESVSRREIWLFWVFAIAWNAVGQPSGYFALNSFFGGNRLAAIGVLFPVGGFWLLWMAIRLTLQMRNFGKIFLKMDPFPGSLGGDVGGGIDLPIPFKPENQFKVSLNCTHQTRHICSDGSSGTRSDLIWQETAYAFANPAERGTRVRFRFAVPADLPESSTEYPSYHQWTVNLSAELPGIDLDRNFTIPVIRTTPPLTSSMPVEPSLALQTPDSIASGIVRIEKHPGRIILFYPPFRNLKDGIVVSMIGGGVFVFSIMLILENVWLALSIMTIFGLLGLTGLLFGIWLIGNSLRVEVGISDLKVVRRFMGIPVKKSHIATSAIRQIEARRYGARGGGAGTKIVFTLRAHLIDGGKVIVGDGIDGRQNAEALARMIGEAGGISMSGAEGSSLPEMSN
ncbi:MAG: DUF3592 domain-containing protein [Geobacter sp.]|nr:DUF3592 domain-containing protein [Geobacter sp.]